jgi:hypothetical protein
MIKYKETKYGFNYGSANVSRICSDAEKGWVIIRVDTPKNNEIEIYVTKTGKIRISDKNGEWKKP